MLLSHEIMGRALCDRGGRVIGLVEAFYRYPAKFDAPWGAAAVTRRRMFFMKVTNLVDLREAVLEDGVVVAAYPIEVITKAPDRRPMVGKVLTYADSADVLAHYGNPGSSA